MSETLETKELKSFFRELEEAITENNRVCNDLEESEERFQESQTLLLALHLKIYSFIRANLNLIEWQAVDDDNFTMLELLIVLLFREFGRGFRNDDFIQYRHRQTSQRSTRRSCSSTAG